MYVGEERAQRTASWWKGGNRSTRDMLWFIFESDHGFSFVSYGGCCVRKL